MERESRANGICMVAKANKINIPTWEANVHSFRGGCFSANLYIFFIPSNKEDSPGKYVSNVYANLNTPGWKMVWKKISLFPHRL